MPVPKAPRAAETDYWSRRPRLWWAVPAAATAAFLLVGVTCLVTAQVQTEHGAGPQRGMAAVFTMFLVFLSFLALCGAWAAAAFPLWSGSDKVPVAVYVFVFLMFALLLGAGWGAMSLATNSIGGK